MEQNKLHYKIKPEDAGREIKKILRGNLNFSRSLVRKIKQTKNISLNGKPCYMSQLVNANDIIEVILDYEGETTSIEPENIPLQIVYENEDLLVIDKNAGMVVHPTRRHQTGTLANAVTYYWKINGQNRVFRAVNRLDKDTSGLLIVANNHYAHQHLSKQIKNKVLKRQYTALVQGVIKNDKGIIDAPIARESETSIKRIVDPKGQKALTNYVIQKRFNDVTLVSLQLETGRTHQIRVHMAHIKHPLLGDVFYGGETKLIDRQALHSTRIEFINPRTNKVITLKSELPEDMKKLV